MSLFPPPGPSLPSFKTLLIKGDYHASAPVHLALSRLAGCGDPNTEAIIITPSRQALGQALQMYKDGWLAANSGCGDVISLSSRIKLYYPPSPSHICLLLSMFRVSCITDIESGVWINSKTTLALPPSIIIIHEPSAYFLPENVDNADPSQWTVSSYIEIVTHGLSSSSFLSSNSGSTHIPCFALFDSRLANMKLPVLTQPDYQDDSSLRLEPLAPIVQRYFEWMVVTNPEQDLIDGDRRKKGMSLHRVDKYPEAAEKWEWWEVPDLANTSGQPGKALVWEG